MRRLTKKDVREQDPGTTVHYPNRQLRLASSAGSHGPWHRVSRASAAFAGTTHFAAHLVHHATQQKEQIQTQRRCSKEKSGCRPLRRQILIAFRQASGHGLKLFRS